MTTSAAQELAYTINQNFHKAFINGKTNNDELIEQSESLITAALRRCRNEALEEAAKIAEWSHMVPPDGGSPSQEEYAVAENAAQSIRNLKEPQ